MSTQRKEGTAEHTFRGNSSVLTLVTWRDGIEWGHSEKDDKLTNVARTPTAASGSLETRWILAAKVDRQSRKRPKTTDEDDAYKLTIHYVKHLPNRKLRTRQVTFEGPKSVCQQCADNINQLLVKYERPKRLLVFVNPQSGHKSARGVYHRKVEPIFALCGIQTTVVVTERHGHSKEVLRDRDLGLFDGIVCLGGDGTFSEVVNGYLERVYRDDQVDSNNPDTILPRPPLPIGCVPLGSGDKIIGFMNETKSVTTAALHIVLGKTQGLDLASVHQHGDLIAYTGLLAGYGLYGRLIQAIEDRRWIPGKLRYSVVPMLKLFRVRDFQARVQILLPKDPAKSVAPLAPHEDSMETGDNGSLEDWRTVEGRFLGVDSFIMQLMPEGKSIRPYMGNGLAQLTIVKPCSRAQHFKHFAKLMKRAPGFYDYDFIEEHWARGYKVSAEPPSTGEELPEIYLMNCDGEVITLDRPEFEVRVHKELVQLYTWLDEDADQWP